MNEAYLIMVDKLQMFKSEEFFRKDLKQEKSLQILE